MGAPLGNTNATKNRPFWQAVNRAIAQEDGKRLRQAAERLLDAAAAGEDWAIRELADRLDGKASQQVTLSGDPDNPVEMNMTVELVSARSDT
jgi:hypothetical protein